MRLAVECDGARHHVSWRAGRLRLDDHGSLLAERALVALGGARPACLAILDTWLGAIDDAGFLAEWADRETREESRQSLFRAQWSMALYGEAQDFLRHLSPERAVRAGRVILTFPQAWLDQLAVAAIRRLSREWAATGEPPARFADIARATSVRARTAMVASLERVEMGRRHAALIPLRCFLAAPDAGPAIEGSVDQIHLTLPPSWLTDVWARGLALVDGDFVLSAGRDRLRAVSWSNRTTLPTPVAVVRPMPGPSGQARTSPD